MRFAFVRDLNVQCSLQVRNFESLGFAMSDCCRKPATSAVEFEDGRKMWRCPEHEGIRTITKGRVIHQVEIKEPLGV